MKNKASIPYGDLISSKRMRKAAVGLVLTGKVISHSVMVWLMTHIFHMEAIYIVYTLSTYTPHLHSS